MGARKNAGTHFIPRADARGIWCGIKNSPLPNCLPADTAEAEYLPKKNGNNLKMALTPNISTTHVAEQETETVRITISEKKI